MEAWVGVVGVVAGALIAGLIQWLLGSQQRASDREARTTARAEAVEDRQREQRASVYIDLLEAVAQTSFYAQALKPIVDSDPPRELPPRPTAQEWHPIQARLGAYGSKAVRDAFQAWTKAWHAIEDAAYKIDLQRSLKIPNADLPSEERSFALYGDIQHTLKPAERDVRESLRAAIADELQYKTTTDPPPQHEGGPVVAVLRRWRARAGTTGTGSSATRSGPDRPGSAPPA